MTSQAIEGACAFAWRNYLLLHSGVSENDNRRSALSRYVTNLRDTGEYDFDLLQIAAVAYLKKLDELHDDPSCETCGRSGVGRAVGITHRTTRHLALGLIPEQKEQAAMADNTSNSDRFARDAQRRTTAATAIGIIALKPIMHFQVSMLRMWADSIERFAGNYEKGFEETSAAVEKQSDKDRAA